eukprot:12874128-Alexandrium_andersonii.AAC.1
MFGARSATVAVLSTSPIGRPSDAVVHLGPLVADTDASSASVGPTGELHFRVSRWRPSLRTTTKVALGAGNRAR